MIVDRSGSMIVAEKQRAAILATMLIHLVGSKLKIEHEIVVTPGINVLANLKSGERGKALVAGIRGTIHTEDMNRTLRDQGARLLKSRATTRCHSCEACCMRHLFGEGLILASASDMHTHIASSLKSLRVFI